MGSAPRFWKNQMHFHTQFCGRSRAAAMGLPRARRHKCRPTTLRRSARYATRCILSKRLALTAFGAVFLIASELPWI